MTDPHPTITPAPVRKSVAVAASPETAFAIFTASMGRWWPPSHAIGTAPMADVVIEPFAGGRWYERGADGSIALWGDVREWSPPHRVVLIWRLDSNWRYRPDLETEVEVTFTPEGAGARVTLEHRGLDRFGAQAEAARGALDGDRGWGWVLGLFAGTAEDIASSPA